jgi:hypothetical protein
MDGNQEYRELPKGVGTRTDILRIKKEKTAVSLKDKVVELVKSYGYKLDPNGESKSDPPPLGSEPLVTLGKMLSDYGKLTQDHKVLCFLLSQYQKMEVVANSGVLMGGGKLIDSKGLARFRAASSDFTTYIKRIQADLLELRENIKSASYMLSGTIPELENEEYDEDTPYPRV